MHLHAIHGGLALEGHKAASAAGDLRACPPPPRLVLALRQHAGLPARPVVAVGERVARGQVLALPEGSGAPVHAPLAARVLAIEDRPLPGQGAPAVPHLVLEPTGSAEAALLAPLPDDAEPGALRTRIAEAGLVGLGGAGFPTAGKLDAARELVIINGAECEPWISCDDALLRAHAGEVLRGARLLARAAGARRVLLAVEDDMREALAACRAAAAEDGGDIEVVAVPARYPAGGERQLIQALTGREVPRGGLPRDLGIVVFNVGTARAAWRAVALGEPLVERVVTVTGPGVAQPGNFLVPLGTPVSHLVELAGGYTPLARRLLLGGPMMGTALAHDDFPIGKTQHCVLVLGERDLRPATEEMPCIRCGDCASACPARLLPQQLLWQARADRLDDAREQGLPDCIECGCCDLACPSHIPLTETFRRAKGALLARDADAADAAAAKARFEARQQRLEREAAEREARLAARKAAAASPEAVAAALERARARRAAQQNPDEPA
ncbi:electron transport complex subunit RsxC [Arenimonas sp.]|uniref:electron transport complex subunit RsxC n=1 Tax=Arenimonas sp. TaxID=1872635 RepID=UPI0025DAA0A5|nr:electron transport complex subunit RsxC [Arenimonas sp.]